MKKVLPVIIGISIILAVIISVLFFILQLRDNSGLKKEMAGKQEEFSAAQSASRKMEELEKKGQELKQQEVKMKRRVPVSADPPLELIKIITSSAGKLGLRQIKFEISSSSAVPAPDKKSASSGTASGELYFQMKFDGTYAQVFNLLKDISSLERIVKVEKIEISRNSAINPYQSVVMDMVTYYAAE